MLVSHFLFVVFTSDVAAKKNFDVLLQLLGNSLVQSQEQLSSLTNNGFQNANLSNNCYSTAWSATSANAYKIKSIALMPGNFQDVFVAETIKNSGKSDVSFALSFPALELNEIKNALLNSSLVSLQLSAFYLENTQKGICAVPSCPKHPSCIEKLDSSKLNEYRRQWNKASTKLSEIVPCNYSSVMPFTVLPKVSTNKDRIKDNIQVKSSIEDKLELPIASPTASDIVHEAAGTIKTMKPQFEKTKITINITATWFRWSAKLPDSFLKGVSNINASVANVVLKIRYIPELKNGTQSSNVGYAFFSHNNLPTLILAGIFGFCSLVVLITLLFCACNRSKRAFDVNVWDYAIRKKQNPP